MIDSTKIHYSKYEYNLGEILEHVRSFKEHLDVINAGYLSEHLIVEISHHWVTYRDPDRDWYYKSYNAKLDKKANEFCRVAENNLFIFVHGSKFYDYYLSYLLDSYKKELLRQEYTEEDIEKANSALKIWKDQILHDYNREEHIRVLLLNLASFYKEEDRNRILSLGKDILCPNKNLNFKEIHTKDMLLEVLDYKVCFIERKENYQAVRLKHCHGIFGGFTKYGNNHSQSSFYTEKEINIPLILNIEGRGLFVITEVGESVFDNLINIEKVILPMTIQHIDWSFWNCKGLKEINICESNSHFVKNNKEYFNNWNNLGRRSNWCYLRPPYIIKRGEYCTIVYAYDKQPALKSIDGVLYNFELTELIAFPNMHAKKYEIPEGVIKIRAKAFKDCDNLEELFIPSTLREIGVNAFYRCVNLKRIIVNQKVGSLAKEKRVGDYGDVNPDWYWKE